MDQFVNWLAMGGYSSYVWPAYALVFLVLILNVISIKKQKMKTHQKLQQWFKR